MATHPISFCIFLLSAIVLASSTTLAHESQETFIIHASKSQKPAIFSTHHHWYSSTLKSLPQYPHPTRILYTYDQAVHGFAARLIPAQADALSRVPGILSVLPERIHQLHTTHTPDFLGLAETSGIWPNSDYAEDVIVGVLDTGIWPERRSFSNSGLSAVPTRWKGACEAGPEFPISACNGKIIGARFFYKGYEASRGKPINETAESKSPRDTEGHGTHTASTAAGAAVSGAGLFEYAVGEARGMATKARIAAYKICWLPGCYDSDILAAMDQAVADGVHVISLSVGATYATQYDYDSIAIGAFGATEKGVLVSCSAGNSGPGPYTATNLAPWILTVGASTIDREFPADAVLGDGNTYGGVSLYSGDPLGSSNLPLVYSGDCGSSLCYSGRLDSSKVRGKIVLCDRGGNARVEKGAAVKLAGGAAMILANTAESGEELIADAHLLPSTMVGQKAGDLIRNYAKSGPEANATILFRGTVISTSPPAPKVAAFSSRGPNRVTPEILTPDVIAPGVNILAGWTGSASPTDLDIDPRRVEFNIISGTSMSCPHVSGLAALLRKAYPDWTPAALKSALMTTAYNLDNSGETIKDLATEGDSTPYDRGAGHVDPNRALNPGLVYDIDPVDYVAFLCSIGYDARRIAVFVKDQGSINCSAIALASPGDLNYPSFSVVFKSDNDVVKYSRVVKNVGRSASAVYEAKFLGSSSVEISVSPSKLVFNEQNQRLSYVVTFATKGDKMTNSGSEFGWIAWSDGEHVVRSPIAFSWPHAWVSSI